METLTATNNLQYTVTKTKNGVDVVISIRLNDECHNGHNDFSITGERYTVGKRGDRNWLGGGAIGDEIAKQWPEFKIFNDLHLCDAKGAPMYAEANGFYHLKQSPAATTINYLRITEGEYKALSIAEDQKHFTYLLQAINIPARWEAEAKKAIAKLEELTGQVFEDDSRRYQFTPLSDIEQTDIIAKIEAGYYSTSAIKAREEAKKQADLKKQFDAIEADRDSATKKAENEYQVKHAVLSAGLPLNNFIYYSHSNKGVFNWKDYEKKISGEQLAEFNLTADFSKLPKGITFGFEK